MLTNSIKATAEIKIIIYPGAEMIWWILSRRCHSGFPTTEFVRLSLEDNFASVTFVKYVL